MIEKTKVVLLAADGVAQSFKTSINAENFTIAAHTRSKPEFIKAVKENENAIALVDTMEYGIDVFDDCFRFMREKKYKYFVIVKSASVGFEFLAHGAIDMFVKGDRWANTDFYAFLFTKMKNALSIHIKKSVREFKYKGKARSDKVVLIGSSTGGAETAAAILEDLPIDMPPIIVVQHMPPVFTKLYADRLDTTCAMSVFEAQDADALLPGVVLVAPGDYQTKVARKDGVLCLSVAKGEKVNNHAPSVDVLFSSAADVLGNKAIGVILTGMGGDGAAGLYKMRQRGAFTIGQDAVSCIVYGMPKVAFEMGAVVKQAHLKDIAGLILKNL